MEEKKVKLRPLGNRVLVTPKAIEEKRKGSIIIVEGVQEQPNEGTIVAVGTGRTTDDGKVIPLNVKVGDYILYGKYAGSELKVNDEKFITLVEEDIIGVLENA